MKILWFLASFSAHGRSIFSQEKALSGSGNWIDDEAECLLHDENISELIQMSSCGTKWATQNRGRITFIDLGLGELNSLNSSKRIAATNAIKGAIFAVSPDIVQVWGTENPVSLIAVQCGKELGIPVILCPQGLVSSLLHFPNGHVSSREMCGGNILNWLKMPLFNKTKRIYQSNVSHETQAIKLADYILSDNQWTFDYCRCVNPSFCPLWYPLPVNECFTEIQWSKGECSPHTIMSVSPRSSYKGQHILLKAVGRLKNYYGDIRVLFPAMENKMAGTIESRIKRTPYNSMLRRLINEQGLAENVVFLNRLSPKELASVMCQCNVFVNPSVIESNCMSLREAMWMGMPVISAFAGSIQEYLVHDVNGILYRYEEDEILACELDRLFSNFEKCVRLGASARSSMKELYSNGVGLFDLYKTVMNSFAN